MNLGTKHEMLRLLKNRNQPYVERTHRHLYLAKGTEPSPMGPLDSPVTLQGK